MKAKAILGTKGSQVITTRPETVVADAFGIMVGEKIGSLVVCGPNQDIVGIITERDVLHELVEHGSELLQRQVTDLMSRDVVTASLDDDVGQLMAVMTEHHCRQFR
jgi:CBS domain-containing protein